MHCARRVGLLLVSVLWLPAGVIAGHGLVLRQAGVQRVEGFEVVSVRPSRAGEQLSFGVTAEGYSARNTPLFWIVMEAYCPLAMSYWKSDRLVGGPAWVRTQGFDVEGRVSEGQVKEFAWLSDEEREARVKPMLRAMLEERFGLRVHAVERRAAVLELVVGKGRPKLEASRQGGSVPSGIEIGNGGVEVPIAKEDGRHGMRFYRTSMARFAEVLSGLGDEGDLPIVDRTGLAGAYDFVLVKREAEGEAGVPRPATFWDVEALGFRLKRAEEELPAVMVDHVDEPTAN